MAEGVTPGTFIPHDTATPAPAVRRSSSGGLGSLILLCSIVLVVASVALGIGVFLYAQLLHAEGASKVDQLKRAEAAFQPALVQQLTRLDDRMHAGAAILGQHRAPTAFFAALSQATLQTVSFQTLALEATEAEHITIKMQGVARSVNSIALQADLFSKNGVIMNPIFSNIARQLDGVHFDLTAIVNPVAINYASLARSAANGIAPSGAVQQNPATNTGAGSELPFGQGAPSVQSSQTTPKPSNNGGVTTQKLQPGATLPTTQ